MLDNLLDAFHDLESLPANEQAAIMLARTNGEEGEIERFMRRLFVWAAVSKSSDVHIEGRGERNAPDIFVHVRTPGGMVNMEYKGALGRRFQAKMFELTGIPQGGSTPATVSTRFSMELPAHYANEHGLQTAEGMPYAIDIRVEYARTFDGFTFVSRLLDQQRRPALDQLGLSSVLLNTIARAAQEPSGLILVSGPTGSGKTTLLNSVLGYVNDGQRAITTIENPVEFRLHGTGPIKQLQVDGEFTFARALRSALRQDPDVILVGEIRDEETLKTAIEAAQTGHMVLSTVHAKSSHETITRLLKMGADPLILAEVLKVVMAQRLINRYEGVPVKRALTRDEKNWFLINGMSGVEKISEVDTANKRGKTAIVEAIVMDDGIKQLVRRGLDVGSNMIYRLAAEQSQYESLAAGGIRAVESSGGRVKDCMGSLENNSEAQAYPGLRIRLAKEFGLTYAQVGQAIDLCGDCWDDASSPSLRKHLQEIKGGVCVEEFV